MRTDFEFENYKNHKLDCILTSISKLELPHSALNSLKAIVLYDFFENEQNNDKHTKYPDTVIIEQDLSLVDISIDLHHTTGIRFPEQLSRYINRFLFQLERINIPNFVDLSSSFINLSENYFDTYSEIIPLCDILKIHGYVEYADVFTPEYLSKNTLIHFAYDIFSLRDNLNIPVINDFPLLFFPNVPTFNEVFFNYLDKSTYYYSRYQYANYISDWFFCRVTLLNWKSCDKINVIDLFNTWKLNNELLDVIHDHALSLYSQFVDEHFNKYYKSPFDNITDSDIKYKTAIKNKDIIINLSIGDLSIIDIHYAKEQLKISNIKSISNQLLNANNASHHDLSNINIQNPQSTAVADALLLYKDFLNDFLNPQNTIIKDHILYDFVKFDSTVIKKSLSPNTTPGVKSFIKEHVPILDDFSSSFQSEGCIYHGDIPIYSLWLGVFLNDRKVLVKNRSSNSEERLDGSAYRNSYIQGFNEGCKYFDDTYHFTSAEFYANANSIVADLKFQYDNASCDFGFGCNGNYGWKVIKDPDCFIKISHKSINKFGYYSGIVSSLTTLSKIYPNNFNDFFNSDKPFVSDYRFLIKSEDYFKNSSHNNLEIYNWAVHEIERKDYAQPDHIQGNIKFFTPHMVALLLTEEPIPVFNIDKNREPATISSKPYLETYMAGYKEGVEFFNTNYSLVHNVEIKSLYEGKPDFYVNALKSKYFAKDIEDEATDNHWNFVTIKDLYLISHKEIKKYGLNSGIVGEVKSLIAKHPDLFKDFYNSDNYYDVSDLDITYQLAVDFIANLSEKNLSYFEYSTSSFNKGYISYDTDFFHCKFFNLQLYSILFFPDPLDVTNPLIDKKFSIKGSDYLRTYIDAYKEGEDFFQKTYNFDLYKPEKLVETIKHLYFPKDKTLINNRNYWSYVYVLNPFIISHSIVKDYGYNSGIINKVQKLIELHPVLFKDFYINSPIPIPQVFIVNPLNVDNVYEEDDNIDDSLTTKFESLKTALYKYGFDKISFIDFLPVPKRDELIAHLCNQNLNYQIAMLNYLDFINYIVTTYEISKNKRNIILSEILGFNNDNIRKCIYSLDNVSSDNRFFAINFAQDVKSYCLNLRNRA